MLSVKDQESLYEAQVSKLSVKTLSQVTLGIHDMQMRDKSENHKMQTSSDTINSIYTTHTLKHYQFQMILYIYGFIVPIIA